jgi:hypothetical protein
MGSVNPSRCKSICSPSRAVLHSSTTCSTVSGSMPHFTQCVWMPGSKCLRKFLVYSIPALSDRYRGLFELKSCPRRLIVCAPQTVCSDLQVSHTSMSPIERSPPATHRNRQTTTMSTAPTTMKLSVFKGQRTKVRNNASLDAPPWTGGSGGVN